MTAIRRILGLLSASVFLCGLASYGQDSPSLGDVARQSRLQKQQKDAQAKDAQAKDAVAKDTAANGTQPPKTAKKVITNDELPEHTGPTRISAADSQTSMTDAPEDGEGKAPAEYWKSQIQQQKNAVASLQSNIKELEDSIRFAPGNCVRGCVQWNEHQKEKQEQVEAMKSQLEEQQKHLEEMQDTARKQGYGSSVYDP